MTSHARGVCTQWTNHNWYLGIIATSFPGPAEANLNWSGRVRDCVHMHAAAKGVLRGIFFSNLMFWDRFWGHFGPFFSLICSSWQAGFWFNLARLYASDICSGSLLIWTSRTFTRSQTPAAQTSCSRASDERCNQGRTMHAIRAAVASDEGCS